MFSLSLSPSLSKVADQISATFLTQQLALQKIKERVEQVYQLGDFTDRPDVTECCNVVNLTENYEFGLPVKIVFQSVPKMWIPQ